MIALNMSLFLATTDTTIVSTSLATIVADLDGSDSDYAWVGVSYMLMQTSFQPLYAKLSDIFGRKVILFVSMAVFMLSSCLCGTAQSMLSLILLRGMQGAGGGGIVAMAWIIPDDLIPKGEGQAKWAHMKSFAWGMSAVSGPLLGGLFSDTISWRWAFFINIPIGAIAGLLLCIFLIPQPVHVRKPWSETVARFDWLGAILLTSGTAAIIVGLSNASRLGFVSLQTLPLIIGGVILFGLGILNEAITKRDAVLPPKLFRAREPALLLAMTFLHNFAFTAGTFYLALYYQAVDGSSALMAGVLMLPYSLGSCLISFPAGRWGEAVGLRRVYWTGFSSALLGFGLMITLNAESSPAVQAIYPLVAAVGIGLLFHCFKTGLQLALPGTADDAGATSAFFLVRFIGATTGLSLSSAIFSSTLTAKLPAGLDLAQSTAGIDYRALHFLTPILLRDNVLSAVSQALSMVWIVCAALLGFALLLSLLTRHHEPAPPFRMRFGFLKQTSAPTPPTPCTTITFASGPASAVAVSPFPSPHGPDLEKVLDGIGERLILEGNA
ncbi:MFS general substrate transporter [Calocera viscosa TUFC12733]|uniref:MFS general substrate transporter n=1 Tax=Calocera viscosa (strain TUFC12733) TaxID=1330018 RepID=A0A167RHC4_CALVF|nr:MFS general substrate transporter [Calocera viscosa TUFC12733]